MSQFIEKQLNKVDYNLLAVEYAIHRQVQPEVFTQLVSQSEITGDSQVLEVGCGTGNYISAIQTAVGSSCWGIDPSFRMLAKARENCKEVDFSIGCGEEIEFPENYFDLVFSVDVIHHMMDKLKYFREGIRVLRPGGRISTVTESFWMIRARKPFAFYFPETVKVDLLRYPNPSVSRNMMELAGFENFISQEVTFTFLRSDIQDFRDKAYSCLHLISEDGFRKGIEQMEADLKLAPNFH